MPRRQKLYHYIYKTTCQVTDKFYVGMHSTDDLNDGYLGSGKILGYSRKKHGDENHKREILEMCPSREALKLREKEIVNEALLANPLNINLKYGGEGGWDHMNDSSEKHKARSKRAGFKGAIATWNSNGFAVRHSERHSKRMTSLHKDGKINTNTFSGRKHTAETIEKMKAKKIAHGVGSANSQFGTCWITKDGKSITVKIDLLDSYLCQGYRRGRK